MPRGSIVNPAAIVNHDQNFFTNPIEGREGRGAAREKLR
jgi:hypothetical protein